MQLILEPGFSTAGAITQQAGRGVGMDVVATEIKRLGGALHMETKAGEGTRVHHPPAVHAGDQPRAGGAHRRGVLRAAAADGRGRAAAVEGGSQRRTSAAMPRMFEYGGQKYRFQHLATLRRAGARRRFRSRT